MTLYIQRGLDRGSFTFVITTKKAFRSSNEELDGCARLSSIMHVSCSYSSRVLASKSRNEQLSQNKELILLRGKLKNLLWSTVLLLYFFFLRPSSSELFAYTCCTDSNVYKSCALSKRSLPSSAVLCFTLPLSSAGNLPRLNKTIQDFFCRSTGVVVADVTLHALHRCYIQASQHST